MEVVMDGGDGWMEVMMMEVMMMEMMTMDGADDGWRW